MVSVSCGEETDARDVPWITCQGSQLLRGRARGRWGDPFPVLTAVQFHGHPVPAPPGDPGSVGRHTWGVDSSDNQETRRGPPEPQFACLQRVSDKYAHPEAVGIKRVSAATLTPTSSHRSTWWMGP